MVSGRYGKNAGKGRSGEAGPVQEEGSLNGRIGRFFGTRLLNRLPALFGVIPQEDFAVMADKPDITPPVPGALPEISIDGSVHAPLLYFEDASAFGYMNGIIRVTLEAARIYPTAAQGVQVERVAVAHLRMNVPAARSLITALEGAILLGTQSASESKN
jgi:hypothetical protein